MDSLKRWWLRVPKTVRKPLIFMVGLAVIVTGLAGLVLPVLPGWALIFLGFAVLATEFAAAERVRDWFIAQLKAVGRRAARFWLKILGRHRA